MSKDTVELDSDIEFTDQAISITELSNHCALPVEQVIAMVEYGIIEPLNEQINHSHWRFTSDGARRVLTAVRLQHDLDVNLPGAALAIELLDEIKILREKVANW